MLHRIFIFALGVFTRTRGLVTFEFLVEDHIRAVHPKQPATLAFIWIVVAKMHKSLRILPKCLWALHGTEFESDVDGHLGQKIRPHLEVVI